MSAKDKKELYDFLYKGINGKAYCLYYASYTFDNSINVYQKQKGKINNQNALFTMILPADYDSISEDEYYKYKAMLSALGLETITIFTGHGFQSIVLLDSAVYDCQLLNKWTSLLIRKGFMIDSTLRDAARVLRMPFSFNCKAFDKNNKYYIQGSEIAIPTFVMSWTDRRYNCEEVFDLVESLPDVVSATNEEIKRDKNIQIRLSQRAVTSINRLEKSFTPLDTKRKTVIEEYTMIRNVKKLPDSMVNMLYQTESGLRNATMLFLIPFLKNTLGMDIQLIKKVMIIWGRRCNPILNDDFIISEVIRLTAYDFKGNSGRYTKEMAAAFGFFDFAQYTRQNGVKIPKSLLDNIAQVTDGALRVYLSLLFDNTAGNRNYSIEDICIIMGFSKRAVYEHVRVLVSMKYIVKKKACKKNGESYQYYINPYVFNSRFTYIENETMSLMLQKLTNSEIKLYCYLCTAVYSYNQICMSQNYIAQHIGKSQSLVSELTDSLQQKEFLTKRTDKQRNKLHCVYNLNY